MPGADVHHIGEKARTSPVACRKAGEAARCGLAEHLPEGALARLQPVLERRRQQREEAAAARKAREDALVRLEAVEERIGELTAEDLDQLERDIELALTYDMRGYELRKLMAERREQLVQPS